MASSSWIIEPTAEDFEQTVIERSMTVPVIVDFWAPWCAPCRMLAPVLEQLAQESAGQFILAKVDIDVHQDLAAAFGVQSIPLVVVVKQGQIADGFQGAMAEAEVRAWVTRHLPSPLERLIGEALELETTDSALSETKFREALAIDPKHEPGRIGLARVLCQREKYEEAAVLIGELEKRGYLEPDAEAIKAKIELHSAAAESGTVEEARKAAQANPKDFTLKLHLAEALGGAGRNTESLDLCLEIIEDGAGPVRDQAKEIMIRIMTTMTDVLVTTNYRRKLATVWY